MVRDIVIVGGGVAGWMSALALSRGLAGSGRRISLVETEGPDIGTGPFGPAETTLPGFAQFLIEHDLDEAAVLRASRGSYSLGSAIAGWAGEGGTWFLPFGESGAPMGPVAFHQLAARVRAAGQPCRLADFSLAAIAAQAGRFARPSKDPRSPLSTLAYGLHLDKAGFASLLRAAALEKGVILHSAPFRSVMVTGQVESVTLASGEVVTGDLFLDCSGARAVLAGSLSPFESWKQWLPCDRVIEAADAVEGVPPPYTVAAAHEAGWRRTVPLAGGQGDAILSSSAHSDIGGTAFESGRRARFWTANCIAIGAAAAVVEPIHPVGLHVVQSGLRRLIALFPNDAGGPESAEYNRILHGEADRARDFIIAHYKTNGRTGEPLWDDARAMAVPDELQYKLDLHASRGRVPMYDEEVFDRPDWIALFDGQGVRQRRYDALADTIPEAALTQHFARLRQILIETAKAMPGHGEALK
ncbi:tryptophan 7-halogenase [Sphingomonas sp. AOB5]|uniref:tryptophan halogenase family protein n=1 Tax=Sphingomonas sp. AOB5 TaxID=3034017 RepID=UPI0023F6C990|nr:tryptophan halogenase family protein [Sphingomonas sp. AOB5]MDF7776551.1 tryptophan 7-halogenase [Sphingomonas sp. AOB5]